MTLYCMGCVFFAGFVEDDGRAASTCMSCHNGDGVKADRIFSDIISAICSDLIVKSVNKPTADFLHCHIIHSIIPGC